MLKYIFYVRYVSFGWEKYGKISSQTSCCGLALCNHTTQLTTTSPYLLGVFHAGQTAGSQAAEPSSHDSCLLEACDVGGRGAGTTIMYYHVSGVYRELWDLFFLGEEKGEEKGKEEGEGEGKGEEGLSS